MVDEREIDTGIGERTTELHCEETEKTKGRELPKEGQEVREQSVTEARMSEGESDDAA